MIFDNLAIYCDWLMDQGIECDLLKLLLNRKHQLPFMFSGILNYSYAETAQDYPFGCGMLPKQTGGGAGCGLCYGYSQKTQKSEDCGSNGNGWSETE
jgi:hypothetical protein